MTTKAHLNFTVLIFNGSGSVDSGQISYFPIDLRRRR